MIRKVLPLCLMLTFFLFGFNLESQAQCGIMMPPKPYVGLPTATGYYNNAATELQGMQDWCNMEPLSVVQSYCDNLRDAIAVGKENNAETSMSQACLDEMESRKIEYDQIIADTAAVE